MSRGREDDPEAARLEADLLTWIASAPAGFVTAGATRVQRYGLDLDAGIRLEHDFETLAARLFEFQYGRVAVYRGYCDRRGVSPSHAGRAADIPALPVEAFKRARIATFGPEHERLQFHTSGTTAMMAGVLHLDATALYDLALERGFQHHVLPDRDRIRMLILAATPEENPHSSLGYMFARLRLKWGTPESATLWRAGGIQWRELRAGFESAVASRTPVCLLGTAFAWAQVLDTAEREDFTVALPPGSRLLETGGYKGRSQVLSPAALRAGIERCLGIPATHVVGEYGMTEMASQLYTLNLRQALLGLPAPDSTWSYPAWLRPRRVDSETGTSRDFEADAEPGATGLVTHHDLANRCSVAHLLTADLGRGLGPSFELQGRCPTAEPRGCGLAHETGAVAA